MSHLIISDEGFLDDLHGVYPAGPFEFDHEHLGVGPPPYHPQQLEVIQTVLARGGGDRHIGLSCEGGKVVTKQGYVLRVFISNSSRIIF